MSTLSSFGGHCAVDVGIGLKGRRHVERLDVVHEAPIMHVLVDVIKSWNSFPIVLL